MNMYIKNLYTKLRAYKLRQHTVSFETACLPQEALPNLTKREWKEVKERWAGISDIGILPLYWQLFKYFDHFSSDFVSDDIFMPWILRRLNDINESKAFEHKGYYDILFGNTIKRPQTIANCVRGTFYTADMDILPKQELLLKLKGLDSFIIKPTKGGWGGGNVKKVVPESDSIEQIINEYERLSGNFIIQPLVHQSHRTALFNGDSLNTFRISTLCLNGKVSLCTILFRCGRPGVFVDNGAAGGFMVGVDEIGCFREFAYNNRYERFYDNGHGVKFQDGNIPNMYDIVEKIKMVHQKCLPSIGFAGWDIAIDENDEPVMIEVNLSWPGVQFEQLCPGKPIFGNRTEEVVDFCRNTPSQVI